MYPSIQGVYLGSKQQPGKNYSNQEIPPYQGKKKGQLMKLSSHTTMVIESFSVLEEFGHNNLGPFFTVPSSPTGKNKSNKTKQAELN